jgi:subtilisin-like proprotein convertase family protein
MRVAAPLHRLRPPTLGRVTIRRRVAVLQLFVAAALGPLTATTTAGAQNNFDPLGPAPGHDPVPALGAPVTIPDGSAVGTSSEVSAESFGSIEDLDVRVVLDHGALDQLRLTLIHGPSGRRAVLLDGPVTTTGTACGEDAEVVFDSSAAEPAATACTGDANRPALVGRLSPTETLDVFAGDNIAGDWRLEAVDSETGSVGRIVAWSLHVELALDGFDVAVIAADPARTRRVEVIGRLAGDRRISTVTSLDPSTAISATSLARFDAVVVWTRTRPTQAAELGDALATYVDEGGGVVLAGFAAYPPLGVDGRIAAGGYSPLRAGKGFELITDAELTAVADHPVLAGVDSLRAPSRVTELRIGRGASVVATWSDEAATPLAAVRVRKAGRLVGLNLYPVSDLTDIIGFASGSDGGRLLANAAVWAGAPVQECGGRAPTLEGTPGDDVLVGTPGPDVIVGLGGDDVIRGLGGDDRLCGGGGRDQIEGGRGDDRLFGDGGADELTGGRGSDRADGGLGRDTCRAEVRVSCSTGGRAEGP